MACRAVVLLRICQFDGFECGDMFVAIEWQFKQLWAWLKG